jgi:uncharacterized protein with NRDE domain
MCLILFAYRVHPRYQLVMAGNRDEFYERPTAPMAFWNDAPEVLAGRDLQAGGAWLGVTRSGRFAAITNYRDPTHGRVDAPSRGDLVSNYLTSQAGPQEYLEQLAPYGNNYNGFNLLVGDSQNLFYYSNYHGAEPKQLQPGYYGLSNHLLNTPWPKVEKGQRRLQELLNGQDVGGQDVGKIRTIAAHERGVGGREGRRQAYKDVFTASSGMSSDGPDRNKHFQTEALLALLEDHTQAADEDLPDTGISLAWERILSPIFIESPHYGTRSSTVLQVDADYRLDITEKTWADKRVRHFRLQWPSDGIS